MSWWKPQPNPFWPLRKLFICYSIFRNPDCQQYRIADFLFPKLPQDTTLDPFESAAVARCLYNLEDCGITVSDAVLDAEQKLIRNRSEESEEDERHHFLGRVFRLFADKLFQRKPESFSNAWLRQSLNDQEYMWLESREATKLLFPSNSSFDDYKDLTLPLVAPHFYTYTLDINHEKLDRAVRSYLTLYQDGKLSLFDTNYFSYERTRAVSQALLNQLRYWQKNNEQKVYRPKPWPKDRGRYHDDLHVAFSKTDPEGYQAWLAGNYELRLVEDLLLEDLLGRLTITGVHIRTPAFSLCGIRDKESDEINERRYGRLVERLCGPYRTDPVIFFQLGKRKRSRRSSPGQASAIRVIEIEPVNSTFFNVYLNEDYFEPIEFRRASKTGELLYTLAHKGRAALATFRRQYEYIRSGRDFKLFTRSRYARSKILDRSKVGRREVIVPETGVEIRLLKK